MNTNVTNPNSEIASSYKMSHSVLIQETVRILEEAKKYAEMHQDTELLYFITMAAQCAREKMFLSIYETN